VTMKPPSSASSRFNTNLPSLTVYRLLITNSRSVSDPRPAAKPLPFLDSSGHEGRPSRSIHRMCRTRDRAARATHESSATDLRGTKFHDPIRVSSVFHPWLKKHRGASLGQQVGIRKSWPRMKHG